MKTKTCTKCKIKYQNPPEHFSKEKRNTDGLRSHCKSCIKLYIKSNKKHLKEYNKKYYINNKHLKTARDAKRRSVKLQAIPLWIEYDLIKELYKKASILKHHVDHIVPLQHNRVCGLHCIDNLQILSPYENISKSNKFKI